MDLVLRALRPTAKIAILPAKGLRTIIESDYFICLKLVGWVTDNCVAYQYAPCIMCQINACERAVNQGRLRETRLVLELH